MKKGVLLALTVTGLLPLSQPVFATQDNEHAYIGARMGWSNYQDACANAYDKCEEDALGYGLYAGYQFLPWLAIEAGATDYNKVDASYPAGSVQSRAFGAELTAKLSYELTETLDVYTRLGAGYQSIKKESTVAGKLDGDSFSPVGALGLDYSLSKDWSVRGEYQFTDGIGDGSTAKSDLHFTSLGLTYHFGQSSQELTTQTPVVTENNDSRNIINNKVENKQKEISLSTETLFETDSYKIKSFSAIKNIANDIKYYQQGSVLVVGHSDSIGSTDYNQSLSEKRAKEVADYLREQGINSSRIKVQGMGELSPVASNDNEEGRALNRRVDVTYETIIEITEK
ncbi:Outer membrane protein A precursor [Vibrio chagasii]|nr:Outer membrane protein A precursor [Vibrio chagasii]